MKEAVEISIADGIAVVSIDNPPVNALSKPVRIGLMRACREIATNAAVRAVVIHCVGRSFSSGGDISEFPNDFHDPHMNEVLAVMDTLDQPLVAALHGAVLGGGLELALACHYRVAVADTTLGFPEISLGIPPGAGGTQRLPRLIGVIDALEMMLTAQSIKAAKALQMGLIDALVEGDVREQAVACARRLVADRAPVKRLRERAIGADTIPNGYFEQQRQRLREVKGNDAALKIIRCIEAATQFDFDAGMAIESECLEAAMRSPQAAALMHLFFAERAVAKIPGLPKDTVTRPIEKIGVVGAGTMGGGIAMSFLNAGFPVSIVETKQEALDRGVGIVRKNYEASAAKGKLSAAQVEDRMARLHGSLDYAALADCDLVIEAVFENLEIKQDVTKKLGRICKPGAIIATNTSMLDVDGLARHSGRPAEYLGMHFFTPAHVMRLLEVVRGAATAPDVLATVMQVARRIGKVGVVSGVCVGFIGNRLIETYLRESEFLLLEGATPSQIDAAIEGLGLAMGPCRMVDLTGPDVNANTVIERAKAGALPPDSTYRIVVRQMLDIGRHGQKTGQGFYRYEGRKAVPDESFTKLCEDLAAEHGIVRRKNISNQEIIERCLYPLISEGARVLEEGIAYRADDIDVIYAVGYGFPRYLGGPLFWADQIGLKTVVERLAHYAATRGDQFGYWTPAPLLVKLAAEGRRLSSWTAL